MNKMKLPAVMDTMINKTAFNVRQHSPGILLAAGILTGIGACVAACRATLRIQPVIEGAKQDIAIVHSREQEESAEYEEKDARSDLAKIYIHTGLSIAKEYWPAVTMGTVSIVSVMAGNNVMRNRNAALTAAYTTIAQSFNGYRSRVRERYGEEAEREIRYDIRAKEIKEQVTDPETGKKKTVKKTAHEIGEGYHDYARVFDESCKAWEKNPKYSRLFLQGQQELCNQLLRAYGFLYLNDVYDMLGITKTAAGQVVGWIYDPDTPTGDNYVDFRISEMTTADGSIVYLLDFNVDGAITSAAMNRGLMVM